jgi:hypothetical protein
MSSTLLVAKLCGRGQQLVVTNFSGTGDRMLEREFVIAKWLLEDTARKREVQPSHAEQNGTYRVKQDAIVCIIQLQII